MKTLSLALFFIFAGSLPANFVCAANPLDIVISEIAWMGTKTSPNDEWIELFNNTTSTIDITNWTLKSSDGSPDITFHSEIGSKTGGDIASPAVASGEGGVSPGFLVQNQGFYLMERTDDDTIMDIPADYIYTGALNNSGESLELRDAQGNLIDAVNCALRAEALAEAGWPAGDNETKQTMERKNLLITGNANNWQTSALSGGTPLTQNSIPFAEPANHQLSIINNQSFPSNIIINEILPSPDGADSENEWIEIFNQNNWSVDISNWKIADTQGSVKSYLFPQNTIIKAKSFLLLPRPQTKITLNNDADGLNLIQPDGTITHSVAYTKAKLNQSYNRVSDNWVWSDTLTPNAENIISVAPVASAVNKKIGDVSEFNNSNKLNSETSPIFTKGKVNSVNSDNKRFTASLLALFSAFSILALKRSMKLD